jgi:hypothetical protein
MGHGTAEPVFDRERYLFPDTQRPYDVSHDGLQRFLLTRRSDNAAAGAGLMNVVIVENWVEELKRRVPRQ